MTFADWIMEPRLLDGGMGTALRNLGLDLANQRPEAWNHTHPERVIETHKAFVAAGSSAIHTNSFGGLSSPNPRKTGRIAAELAVRASEGKALVLGSIGPEGQKRDGLADRTRELAEGLVAGGAQCLHFETQYELGPALATISAALEVVVVPIMVSFACRSGSDVPETISGQVLGELLESLPLKDVAAVGANCAQTAAEMEEVVRFLAQQVEVPIIAQPTPSPNDTGACTPTEFAYDCTALIEAGVTLVGGCCGTEASHIRALDNAMRGIQGANFA